MQIMDGTEVNSIPLENLLAFVDCSVDERQKGKTTPWSLEKRILQHLQRKPKSVRTNRKDSFLIEVKDTQEAQQLMALKSVNNVNVSMTENLRVDTCKVLTNVYADDLTDFDTVKEGLMKNKQIRDAVSATWIQSKVPNCRAI